MFPYGFHFGVALYLHCKVLYTSHHLEISNPSQIAQRYFIHLRWTFFQSVLTMQTISAVSCKHVPQFKLYIL